MLHKTKKKENKKMPVSISIASGKGGVGKTSIAVNLALTMASLGSRVTFLDADFGLANAHLLMGYNPASTVRDAISGKSDLTLVSFFADVSMCMIPFSSAYC